MRPASGQERTALSEEHFGLTGAIALPAGGSFATGRATPEELSSV